MWKQQMKWLRNLKHKALEYIFKRYYGNYLYPFRKAEDIWASKSENEQWRLYQTVSDWVTSDAYKIEYDSLIREFYQKLAVESQSEEQVAGYRLALLALKTMDIRLKGLAQKFIEIKILEKTNKLIK